jgi:hypothetical protein
MPTGHREENTLDGVNVSDTYPPTPGSNNSTDDLYASLLGDIGIAGAVPTSVSSSAAGESEAPAETEETVDVELGGADYPLAPQVSRASFVAPSTAEARAYASSGESGDPFETTPFVVDEPRGDHVASSSSAPPTGAFTSPAAQTAQPTVALGANGRPRPSFDEVLYGTAPRY